MSCANSSLLNKCEFLELVGEGGGAEAEGRGGQACGGGVESKVGGNGGCGELGRRCESDVEDVEGRRANDVAARRTVCYCGAPARSRTIRIEVSCRLKYYCVLITLLDYFDSCVRVFVAFPNITRRLCDGDNPRSVGLQTTRYLLQHTESNVTSDRVGGAKFIPIIGINDSVVIPWTPLGLIKQLMEQKNNWFRCAPMIGENDGQSENKILTSR